MAVAVLFKSENELKIVTAYRKPEAASGGFGHELR
jgi:hypothetical protein